MNVQCWAHTITPKASLGSLSHCSKMGKLPTLPDLVPPKKSNSCSNGQREPGELCWRSEQVLVIVILYPQGGREWHKLLREAVGANPRSPAADLEGDTLPMAGGAGLDAPQGAFPPKPCQGLSSLPALHRAVDRGLHGTGRKGHKARKKLNKLPLAKASNKASSHCTLQSHFSLICQGHFPTQTKIQFR